MPLSLEQLQHAFSAVLGGDGIAPALSEALLEDDARAAARLALYRRNVLGTWRQALAAAFPVVEALVGADCFTDLAQAYGVRYPSTSGDLNAFGARFADVIAESTATASLPYLRDVAALEWAVHRMQFAQDLPPVPRERIAALSPAGLLASHFVVHPAWTWFASAHPIASIWAAHQPDSSVELSAIAGRAEFALVTRRRWRVSVVPLTYGDIVALDALKDGADMDRTISAALAADRTFDFAKAFVRWLECDVFVGLDPAQPK